jgi:hypothetical protein
MPEAEDEPPAPDVASASTDRPELAGVHLDARGRSGATESRPLQQVPEEHRRRSLSTEGS